ncbi:MAG: hypothetical protein ACOC84_02990 [Actinomycetota bacterium]
MSDDALGLIPLLFAVVLVPVVCVAVTRSAAEGGLARDGAAGIRTRHTRASDATWQSGHAAALPRLRKTVPVAVITVLAAVAVQVLVGGGWGTAVGLLGLAVETIVLLSSVGRANAAARAAEESRAE